MVAAWDGEEVVVIKNDEGCNGSRLSDACRYQSRHTGSRAELWAYEMNRGLGMLCLQRKEVMCEVLRRREDAFILRRVSSTRHASC
jgi:hypothetical protein